MHIIKTLTTLITLFLFHRPQKKNKTIRHLLKYFTIKQGLSTMALLTRGWIIVWCWGCPQQCKMLSSTVMVWIWGVPKSSNAGMLGGERTGSWQLTSVVHPSLNGLSLSWPFPLWTAYRGMSRDWLLSVGRGSVAGGGGRSLGVWPGKVHCLCFLATWAELLSSARLFCHDGPSHLRSRAMDSAGHALNLWNLSQNTIFLLFSCSGQVFWSHQQKPN